MIRKISNADSKEYTFEAFPHQTAILSYYLDCAAVFLFTGVRILGFGRFVFLFTGVKMLGLGRPSAARAICKTFNAFSGFSKKFKLCFVNRVCKKCSTANDLVTLLVSLMEWRYGVRETPNRFGKVNVGNQRLKNAQKVC